MSKKDEIVSPEQEGGFDDLGIKESILKIINNLGLKTPTPIQRQAIPAALTGQDLVGIAQTGTGKTFAFGIPMLQQLAVNKGRGLVVLPTRELAAQVEKSLHTLGDPLGLRTALVIGGESVYKQIPALRRKPHIIVGTPGRLIDLLKRKTISLENVSVLVFDEADMMFDMGFAPQIEEIMVSVPKDRQTLLFSATMPAAVMKLAEKHLRTPSRVEVAPAGTTASLVDQEIYLLNREGRFDQLVLLLNEYKSSVLVFVRTKHGASKLTKKLKAENYQAAEIHSNLSFSQRQASLAGFRSGKFRILVATDVAARGLDINDIELVLNFDLPDNSEDYVHRIGRTARAGKKGKAISFATPQQRREILKIEQLIRKNLAIKKIASVPGAFQERQNVIVPRRPAKANFDRSGRPQNIPRERPDNRRVAERGGFQKTENYTSLGFKKRAEKIDLTATPDYLQAKPTKRMADRRPMRNNDDRGADFVPLMHNPDFDGGNRFSFRRNLYQLKEAAKPKRRVYNPRNPRIAEKKEAVSTTLEKKEVGTSRPAPRKDFKTGVRTSGSKVFKPKEEQRSPSSFKAKSFTPRHKRK